MNTIIQLLQRINPTSFWLLSGLILSFIPHLKHLPMMLLVFSAVLLGWRICYELRILRLPNRLVRLVLTLTALLITFITFNTLFGRQAGIGLLVIMLCLKLMEMKEDRDVIVAIGLGYFVVITVFFFNQSIFIGLYMLVVVVLLTTALISHTRETPNFDQILNLKLAGTMLLQAAPLTLLLFLLFPRIPGPLWSLPNDSLGGSTGLSETMSPGNISQLSDNDAVAFRVQFEEEIPPSSQHYWRGPVLTYFDGKAWTKTGNVDYETIYTPNNTVLRYRALGKPVNYTVTLEPTNQNRLFGLEVVSELPPDSDYSPDFEVISRHPIQQMTRYKIQSVPDYRLEPNVKPNLARYLQLPGNPTLRIHKLLEEWRENSPNGHQDIVNRALQHFRVNPFYYTRTPPLLLSNPVDEFLFDSKRGFCEHFASSFVYLMRASGIPARVVTGYMGGEMNPVSDYFIVRQSDAHAWAEVWITDKGWLRVDPTAVIPPSRIEDTQDLQRFAPEVAIPSISWAEGVIRQMGYSWDNINHFWNQWILDYSKDRQQDFLSDLFSWFGFENISWRSMVVALVSGMLFVFGVIAFRLFQKDFKEKDAAVIAYQQFCNKMARRGLVRGPAEGPLAFSLRARQQFPELGPVISKITSLYERLRYAPYPPADSLKRLQIAIRQF